MGSVYRNEKLNKRYEKVRHSINVFSIEDFANSLKYAQCDLCIVRIFVQVFKLKRLLKLFYNTRLTLVTSIFLTINGIL